MPNRKLAFTWGHININVTDLDSSIGFYRLLGFDVFIPAIPYLGLTMERDYKTLNADAADALGVPQDTKGRACIMGLGDSFPKIDLIELDTRTAAAPLTNSDVGLVRLCLSTQDLAGEVARLKAEGIEFLSAPQSGHGALADIAVCKDPDGTLIELIQVDLERISSLLNHSDRANLAQG